MDDIIINVDLFSVFCEHLSASVNVVDVLRKNQQLKNPEFDANQDDPIVLRAFDSKMIQRLVELKYPEFLLSCIRNIRILESCDDVFLSEFDSEGFTFYVGALQYLTGNVQIETTNDSFVIHSPATISDLLFPIIGSLHNEMVRTLDYFSKMLDAVDGDPQKLFLNAKSPTPESQYVQIWISSKLGIPGAPSMGIVAVA
jgi:hypothetical protein